MCLCCDCYFQLICSRLKKIMLFSFTGIWQIIITPRNYPGVVLILLYLLNIFIISTLLTTMIQICWSNKHNFLFLSNQSCVCGNISLCHSENNCCSCICRYQIHVGLPVKTKESWLYSKGQASILAKKVSMIMSSIELPVHCIESLSK